MVEREMSACNQTVQKGVLVGLKIKQNNSINFFKLLFYVLLSYFQKVRGIGCSISKLKLLLSKGI